ncbi:MAG: ATP-binding protein [Thermodesulfobacteriota bacterium]
MQNSLSRKRQGLFLIGKELLGDASLGDKLSNVLDHIQVALDEPKDASAWIELDDHTYGVSSDGTKGPFVLDIQVGNRVRGRLCLSYSGETGLSPEDQEFLTDVVHLLDRAVRIFDREAALRVQKERSVRLADNLYKEMWNRTEALANKSGYLEGILRSSDDGIITTDLEHRIVEWNTGAEKMLGFTAEEMQGRMVEEIWESAEDRAKILEEVRSKGGVRNYETRLRTRSGRFREISLTLSLLKDGEGKVLGTVGVSKDITHEKAMVRELELLNLSFRETLHFMNHEFKNSLMVIGGFVRRLLESEEDERRKQELEIIYHHSKFLEAMTVDFLVMAELEHGEFHVRKRLIENYYEEVILPAMLGLKERYPDSLPSYDTSMGGVGNISVMGDPNLLQIVYRNLFGNALKYRSPHGKISYGVELWPGHYQFNVWNEGPGVPLGETEKIFDKFYRVNTELTKQKRGTGLGLYNIRRIIEAHGGRIWCETRPGGWINFLFTLPKENSTP